MCDWDGVTNASLNRLGLGAGLSNQDPRQADQQQRFRNISDEEIRDLTQKWAQAMQSQPYGGPPSDIAKEAAAGPVIDAEFEVIDEPSQKQIEDKTNE